MQSFIYSIKNRIGLILYGLFSAVEGLLNTILYVFYLDKFKVFDFSMPFYFWWSDKVLKTNYLKGLRLNEKANYEE